MIFQTLYPASLVMSRESAQAEQIELDIGGRRLVVEQVSPCQVRIVRLLSTDPADYLHPPWQPGMLITYHQHGEGDRPGTSPVQDKPLA